MGMRLRAKRIIGSKVAISAANRMLLPQVIEKITGNGLFSVALEY